MSNKKMKDQYKVMDTNVLLDDPNAITECLPKKDRVRNIVMLPFKVLDELDTFKKGFEEKNLNSREFTRNLLKLVKSGEGNLRDGITVKDNLIIKAEIGNIPSLEERLTGDMACMSQNRPDHEIISVAGYLKNEGHDVEFISNDGNAILLANSLGIQSNFWRKTAGPIRDDDEAYKGWKRITDPGLKQKLVKGAISPDDLDLGGQSRRFHPNEYLISNYRNEDIECKIDKNEKGAMVLKYDHESGLLKVVPPSSVIKGPIKPWNAYQLIYMDLLNNPDINIVYAIGEAGTSKTFLGVESAIRQSISLPKKPLDSDRPYQRVFLTRPRTISKEESDMGYLPGDMKQKMAPWLAPFFDSLYALMRHGGADDDCMEYVLSLGGSEDGAEMIKKDKVHIFDTTFKRGRTIHDGFWIIDEAQNLGYHQIKALGTRSGENCKVVLAGDPLQSDLPYQSGRPSALSTWNEKFKNEEHSGTIYFPPETSVRSWLASAFIRLDKE